MIRVSIPNIELKLRELIKSYPEDNSPIGIMLLIQVEENIESISIRLKA